MTDRYIPSETTEIGEFSFFADFENASDGFSVSHDEGVFSVEPYSWMHFGVDGVARHQPEFRTPRPDHVDERRRLVWSADGEEWTYFDVGFGDGDWYYFHNEEPFSSDRLYVAGLFPYRNRDLESLLCQLRGHASISNLGPRGYSPDRRPIYGFEIGDSSVSNPAHNIVIIAGQHAWEAWGRQVMHGLVTAAISDAPAASRLREQARLFVYPMANPDGIARGHMRDGTADHNPNRAWFEDAPPAGEPSPVPEIDLLRQAIMRDTGGSATYLLDFHSHAGIYDRCMWYANAEDSDVNRLVEAIHEYDGTFHDDAIVGTHTVGSGGGSSPTGARWAQSLGATGLTFEACPYNGPSRARYRDAGLAFVAGLADVLG